MPNEGFRGEYDQPRDVDETSEKQKSHSSHYKRHFENESMINLSLIGLDILRMRELKIKIRV